MGEQYVYDSFRGTPGWGAEGMFFSSGDFLLSTLEDVIPGYTASSQVTERVVSERVVDALFGVKNYLLHIKPNLKALKPNLLQLIRIFCKNIV
jgi:hypothetical protein